MNKVTEIPPGYYDTAPNYPAERVDEMQELGLQLGDAHAEIRLLKADAERYRWLRDNAGHWSTDEIMTLADVYAQEVLHKNTGAPQILKARRTLEIKVKETKALREVLEALISNNEHAESGGMVSYQKGSPTWQLWRDAEAAIAQQKETP